MAIKKRQFTREFKLQVLHEIRSGKSIAQAAREHQVHPTLIGKWRKHDEKYGERAFAGNGHAYTDDARVAELERVIGQLTVENLFLKKGLARLQRRAYLTSTNGTAGVNGTGR